MIRRVLGAEDVFALVREFESASPIIPLPQRPVRLLVVPWDNAPDFGGSVLAEGVGSVAYWFVHGRPEGAPRPIGGRGQSERRVFLRRMIDNLPRLVSRVAWVEFEEPNDN